MCGYRRAASGPPADKPGIPGRQNYALDEPTFTAEAEIIRQMSTNNQTGRAGTASAQLVPEPPPSSPIHPVTVLNQSVSCSQ